MTLRSSPSNADPRGSSPPRSAVTFRHSTNPDPLLDRRTTGRYDLVQPGEGERPAGLLERGRPLPLEGRHPPLRTPVGVQLRKELGQRPGREGRGVTAGRGFCAAGGTPGSVCRCRRGGIADRAWRPSVPDSRARAGPPALFGGVRPQLLRGQVRFVDDFDKLVGEGRVHVMVRHRPDVNGRHHLSEADRGPQNDRRAEFRSSWTCLRSARKTPCPSGSRLRSHPWQTEQPDR